VLSGLPHKIDVHFPIVSTTNSGHDAAKAGLQMSWLQFIDSMVGRLAWPVVVLIVLIAVRKHLGSLAERILELRFGGATVKFETALSKGNELIEEAPTPSPEPSTTSTEADRILVNTIARLKKWRKEGYAGIPLAYQEIDNTLREIGEQLNVNERDKTLMRTLRARNLISPEHLELYSALRTARNAVTHGNVHPNTMQVTEFTRQAAFLLTALQEVLNKLKSDKAE
jgi:hypothetical protein